MSNTAYNSYEPMDGAEEVNLDAPHDVPADLLELHVAIEAEEAGMFGGDKVV